MGLPETRVPRIPMDYDHGHDWLINNHYPHENHHIARDRCGVHDPQATVKDRVFTSSLADAM